MVVSKSYVILYNAISKQKCNSVRIGMVKYLKPEKNFMILIILANIYIFKLFILLIN